MAGRKSDFTLPTNTLDELFSTQEERDDAKLSKIRDIPLELIDDFPDHPFKVRDDEDILPFRMFSHRTMKLVGCCYEQGITDGNLSGFVAWQIFHLPAHQHHRYETTLYEIMEVKIDEIQSEK